MKGIIIFSVIAALIGLFSLSFAVGSLLTKQEVTNLYVRNPYSMSVDLLVKCDWTGKYYRFNSTIRIPPKTDNTIFVPMGMKKCEIYPHVNF